MSNQTIGIYGGTFDPPHLGHLILAAEARQQLGLSQVLWMLTPTSPFKTGQAITPARQRLAMLELMLADSQEFAISTLEMDRPGPHYTSDSLSLLRIQFPEANLALILGGDSLQQLPGWREPEKILQACAMLGIMRRPGDHVDLDALEKQLPGLQGKIRFVDAPLLEISSSEIRQRVAENGHYQYYLHPKVYDYIQQHQLYR